MKNVFFLALAFLVAACGGSPEGQAVEAQEAVETNATPKAAAAAVVQVVDVEASVVNWVGAKIVGGEHKGTLKLSEGKLDVKDGSLVGGSFVIDMTSMENTDLPDGKKEKLVGHLSTGDFFEVETYPKANFVITSVAAAADDSGNTHNITGNLTMKDVTKSVTFPANVKIENGSVEATTPQFTIDRTQWNVQYGSTTIGALKDEAIDDQVGLIIYIATK